MIFLAFSLAILARKSNIGANRPPGSGRPTARLDPKHPQVLCSISAAYDSCVQNLGRDSGHHRFEFPHFFLVSSFHIPLTNTKKPEAP